MSTEAPREPRADGELRAVLRQADLVLANVLSVVVATWIAYAAKVGEGHVVLWLAAAVTFFLPLMAVVVHLNRWAPLEGGIYQWARTAFGDRCGFLVAWNVAFYSIVPLAYSGITFASSFSYLSASWAALGTSKAAAYALTAVILGATAAITVVGLKLGKWVHNAGGASRLFSYGLVLAIPVLVWACGKVDLRTGALTLALPAATLANMNLFSKMGMGAFCGLEYVAIFNGESRDARRTVGRSMIIAAPVILLTYILATAALLSLVPPEQVDTTVPLTQAAAAGLDHFGARTVALALMAVPSTISAIAGWSLLFAGVARLPMVAGWDGLLPAWFGRLHPRFGTPVNAVLVVALIVAGLAIFALEGTSQAGAFQLLVNSAILFYCLGYLVMFAIPFTRVLRGAHAPRWWLRLASASGFLMTAGYAVFSLVPVHETHSPVVFAMKVAGVVVGFNALGLVLYRIGRRAPPVQI